MRENDRLALEALREHTRGTLNVWTLADPAKAPARAFLMSQLGGQPVVSATVSEIREAFMELADIKPSAAETIRDSHFLIWARRVLGGAQC